MTCGISGMGPGMLGKTYAPDDIRFFTQQAVEKQGGDFILGKAARIDPEQKKLILESGETIPYDCLLLNMYRDRSTFNIGTKSLENKTNNRRLLWENMTFWCSDHILSRWVTN
jgi:NADH dehydrogenase FAD-containing subunit